MQLPNVTGTQALFTVANGQTRWWNVRLFASLVSGSGASVTIQVNSVDPPTQNGGLYLTVATGSYPDRETSADLLLNDGDVVTAVISGGYVDLTVQGSVTADEL